MIATNRQVDTEAWMRNRSDELAVEAGCWFDAERAAYTVWWIERYCRLYEGEHAGEYMLLRSGCREADEITYGNDRFAAKLKEWESAKRHMLERAEIYAEWFKSGGDIQPDWQFECMMRLFGWTRFSMRWQRDIRRFNAASIWVPKKQKKALELSTPIPIPGGWTTVKDIRIGDLLFDVNGQQCRVIDKTETYLKRDCYRVHFSNGESVVCDAGHLWVTSSLKHEVVRKKNRKVLSRTRPFAVRTTEDIYNTQRTPQGSCVHTLKMPAPIQCDTQSLPVDPYLLGFWLGDGDSDGARITFAATDEQEVRKNLSFVGATVRDSKMQHGMATVLRAGIGTDTGSNLRTTLREIGVLDNKHIPDVYLRASVEQRVALLQGLMDTDGHCPVRESSMIIFATSKPRLRAGFAELLSSLGIKFSCKYYECKKYWRFQFMAFRDHVECFRFSRKRDRQPYSHERKWNRSRTVQITKVERVASVPVQCIAIDSPTKEFLFGKTMLPTHNTPTEAAVGLYLTCGDGELGAKTFQGAKDGNQAGIAMAHAIAMVEQSPELASECKINRNENSIEHMPTRSKYRPLSSANERTKNSKEGLNGNILIDETHVVDRDFINIISRAGISRSEPMQFEVSTAGNNPDGYGKERQDYARQVECGAIQNDQLFVAIYEAPAKLTDEELAADPVKYGRMANPAWGHTAHEEEYLADYQQSKRTISGLAQFKMYRLNIWQTTANQWLRLDDWLACGQSEYQLEDFAGEMAAIGMDLSKTRDMSALAVSVPRGDEDYLFVDMWMTEDYARENKDKAAFLEWAASGQLHLIPGSVIQESFLRERFAELCKLLKVKVFVKDKTYATDFTEWVEENYSSVLQVDYPQYANAMEKPIDDFEADVIDGKIRHANNACLNWQAGHAAVHENGRGFRLIQKPKRGDVRKVDGLVSSLMSHWGAKQLPKKNSVYRRRGVLCV